MTVRIHYVGCLCTAHAMADFLDSALDEIERAGAQMVWRSEQEARFVSLDAPDAQLVLLASRLVLTHQPPLVRFGFSSGVMEASLEHEIRISKRSIAQAVELARAARHGEVLLSSQLGSLLQIAQPELAARLRAGEVTLGRDRRASAYWIDWAVAAAAV